MSDTNEKGGSGTPPTKRFNRSAVSRLETDIEAEVFEGRVEHIASYKATRFHLLDELFGFIASVLTEVSNTEQL